MSFFFRSLKKKKKNHFLEQLIVRLDSNSGEIFLGFGLFEWARKERKKKRVCGAPFFPRMDGGKSDGWNDDDGVASFVTVVVVVVYLEVGQ